RKALDLHRQLLGEEHPHTGRNYLNLAKALEAQGKYAEAEKEFRKALALFRQLLGEEHLDTATSYTYLAYNLAAQQRHREAEVVLTRAADTLAQLHPRFAASGLDRATGRQSSALPFLAALLARQ